MTEEASAAQLARRLGDRRPVCFLDYDGTLAPIVERPEDARLSEAMRRTLAEAAAQFAVAVVSGRDLEDVRGLVGMPNLIYAGSHGLDIAGPGLRLEAPGARAALGPLREAGELLAERLAGIPQARLERKRFALAVHCRGVAAADMPRVEDAVARAAERHRRLRANGGKQILELRPAIDWDKGRAVRWLIAKLRLERPGLLPLYIGDDETDEDAFRVLRGNGLGILVAEAPRPTLAHARLGGPEQVRRFLHLLTERSQGRALPTLDARGQGGPRSADDAS